MAKASFTFFFIIFSASLLISVSCHQFQVGGSNGWSVPSYNHSYNFWATQMRFHINDSLHFEYYNDSVLVVNYRSYRDCVGSEPIMRFEDGNTVFVFDRYGYFYFISGEAGHCESGQKLVVRVMVHPLESGSPSYAPAGMASSPEGGDGGEGGEDWFSSGPPSLSSGGRIGYAFYFVLTAILGVFVVSCLFM